MQYLNINKRKENLQRVLFNVEFIIFINSGRHLHLYNKL